MLPTVKVRAVRIFLVPMLVLCIVECALADQAEDHDRGVNSLASGNSALLFQLAENFDLESFSGLTLSIKHMGSGSRAYRLGLSVSAREMDEPFNNDVISTDVTLQRLHHIAADRPVSPFFALGPILGYTGATDSIEWRVGLVLSFGAEWFVRQHLSILGEYGTSLVYHSENIKVETFNYDDEHGYSIPPHRSKALEFAPNAVRLGVSFYW